MKLVGKVVSLEIKDYGKGKDAEAKEVRFATIKIDGRHGLPSGKFTFAMSDEEVADHEYQLGSTVNGSIDQPQQQLDLNGRAADQRRRTKAGATAS